MAHAHHHASALLLAIPFLPGVFAIITAQVMNRSLLPTGGRNA